MSDMNQKTEAWTREVSKLTRESKNQADDIMAISRRCSALPDLDPRTSDEILAYNAAGFID